MRGPVKPMLFATPGLALITAADLKRFWRSDHYGALSNNVLSRPAIVIDVPRRSNHSQQPS